MSAFFSRIDCSLRSCADLFLDKSIPRFFVICSLRSAFNPTFVKSRAVDDFLVVKACCTLCQLRLNAEVLIKTELCSVVCCCGCYCRTVCELFRPSRVWKRVVCFSPGFGSGVNLSGLEMGSMVGGPGGMKDSGGQQSRFKWIMEGHSPAPSPPDSALHKNGERRPAPAPVQSSCFS